MGKYSFPYIKKRRFFSTFSEESLPAPNPVLQILNFQKVIFCDKIRFYAPRAQYRRVIYSRAYMEESSFKLGFKPFLS